jgi:hypothetical protein
METAKKRMATAEIERRPRWRLSLLKRSSILLACLFLVEILLGGLAFAIDGSAGLSASLFALFSCVVGGLLALLVGDALVAILAEEVASFAQAVFGMLVRAAFGLGVCMIAYGFGLSVSEKGLAFYVLAFYMVTLTVETGFAVRQFGRSGLAVSPRVEG